MSDLYERDFYSWTQKQADLIREGRLAELDLDNILEELESMGRSDYRALQSRLTVLFTHLLKWHFQPEKRKQGNSWERTIKEQRKQIGRLLLDCPGLKSKLDAMLPVVYERALEDAHDETNLPVSLFPEQCPWSFQQAVDKNFWPSKS
ncbi:MULTISPECIES: DUF29 domain-containing protein [Gammaproteobacteria]|uniref:DUF29 domain-containing protein n=1 Tax=Gammaproteobacteria TaxID=1236 RepID=UPI001AD9DCD6|nr:MULTISPECIES: DUF29 domain-containing protein [Gammaproteobacteria]MBO9482124.1 DUF29 domain-containing protein [Salinisphaera sp. G21_0]MBO9494646.1 DUF29 domain-containing protein [Thalassotalea sp. G20_0]